jgi:hypothetical protein
VVDVLVRAEPVSHVASSPVRRVVTQPVLRPYNRIIAAVVGVNVVVLWFGAARAGWWSGPVARLDAIALAAQANLTLAVMVRQQHLVNVLQRLVTAAPTGWPLRMRWALAKVYHLGGAHVGAAVSGTLWYLIFVVSLTAAAGPGPASWTLPALYVVVALFLAMVALALPPVRARAHDAFEAAHRFCGWAALVLVWVTTLGSTTRAGATLWLLGLGTASTLLPWLRLRKVPIRVMSPSSHVALVHVDEGRSPFVGSTRAISRHPLFGWHWFANIPAAGGRRAGYRMAVSRAGDWTARFIDDPPDAVWVRGVPVTGVANVRRLFTRVVIVATGSGIGPVFGHLGDDVPAHLVWVTRDPRGTYGDGFVNEIMAAAPDATIWNTDERSKPDVLALAYAAYLATGAEAVICVANRSITQRVVHGLEQMGIPAFGPIWDS